MMEDMSDQEREKFRSNLIKIEEIKRDETFKEVADHNSKFGDVSPIKSGDMQAILLDKLNGLTVLDINRLVQEQKDFEKKKAVEKMKEKVAKLKEDIQKLKQNITNHHGDGDAHIAREFYNRDMHFLHGLVEQLKETSQEYEVDYYSEVESIFNKAFPNKEFPNFEIPESWETKYKNQTEQGNNILINENEARSQGE